MWHPYLCIQCSQSTNEEIKFRCRKYNMAKFVTEHNDKKKYHTIVTESERKLERRSLNFLFLGSAFFHFNFHPI